MAREFNKPGRVLIVTIACVAGASAVAASVALAARSASLMRARSSLQPPAEASRAVVAATLVRIGLGPDALAAVGVQANATAPIFSNLRSHLAEAQGDLLQAETTYMRAQQQLATAEEAIRTQGAGARAPQELESLRAALTSAASARDTLVAAAFTASTVSLTEQQTAALRTIRGNRGKWELPLEYLTVDRTEAEWVALREALTNQRVSLARGETPNSTCLELVSSAQNDNRVSTAAVALQSNRDAVTTAWANALGQ